jgi:hypothetical protein
MISISGHEYHDAQSSYHFHDLTYQGFCKTHVSHGNKALSSIAETNSRGLDAFNVDYNKKDPPMSIGTVYSDMDAFKIALPTHVVKHEFNYDIEKSDTGRYRVSCS